MNRLTREQLEAIGFKERNKSPFFSSMIFAIGRHRYLNVASVGTPNEMMLIQCNSDAEDKIEDQVVIHNYDYDGWLTIEKVQSLVQLLKGGDGRVKTPLISEEHTDTIFVPIITALHPSRSVIVLTGDDINDLKNCIRRFTEYDFETHSAGLTDAIRDRLIRFGVNLPTAQLLSRAWIKPEFTHFWVSYENISEEHVIHIVEPILSRLSEHHKINLSDTQVEELKNCISLFKEPDFEKASDVLTEAIYNKLKEFGVDDITAKRCSWKWSD